MKYTIRETNFTPLEWAVIVDSIAEGYFFENKYTPHFGLLNTMRIFYNECVEKIDNTVPEKALDLDSLDSFINDPDFILVFNNEFEAPNSAKVYQLSFAQAFKSAMEMVKQRTNAWGELTNILSDAISKLIEYAQNLASEENLNLLQALASSLADKQITADDIVEAYGKIIKKNVSE